MALNPHTIYYGIDGERQGPVDVQTLREMIRAGQLLAHDFVWDEDLEDWVEIGRYEELHDETPWREGLSPALEALPPDHPSVRRDPAPLAYAGFGGRLVAWIIDLFVLMPLTFLWQSEIQDRMGMQFSDVLFGPTSTDPQVALAQLKFLFVGQVGVLLIRWVYYATFESSQWQATPGKKLMRLVVTDERGYRLTFGRASGRLFAKLLSELTLFYGFLMIAFTERHQGLHDKVARTLVLHR